MRNIFKSKRNILIMMFALVVIMGIGFAAYSQQLQINDTSSIDSDWNVYIKDVSVPDNSSSAIGSGAVDKTTNLKADLKTDLKYPGDYVIYKLIVANDGNIDAVLEKINFSMQKEGTVIKYYYSVDDRATWNEVTAEQKENPYNEDLLAKTTDDFYVKVEYDPTKTGTATEEEKSNTLTLEFIYAQKTGGNIPIQKTIDLKGTEVPLTNSDNGLYEEPDGKYIYKGENPDNYLLIGNSRWRIISLEEDGTLKAMSTKYLDLQFDSNYFRGIYGVKPSNSIEGTRYSSKSTDFCYQSNGKESSYEGCKVWGSNTTMLNSQGNNITKMPLEMNGTSVNLPSKETDLNTYLNTTYLNKYSNQCFEGKYRIAYMECRIYYV